MPKKINILFVKLDNLGDHIIFFEFLNKNIPDRKRFNLILLTSQSKSSIQVIKSRFWLKRYFYFDYIVNPVFSRTPNQDFYISLFDGFKIAPKGDNINYTDNEEYLKYQSYYDLILDHSEFKSEYVKYDKFINLIENY